MNRELDRSLARIKDARDKNLIDRQQAQRLAESAVRGAIGEPRPKQESATASKGVAEVIDRAGTAANGGSVRVTRPEGTVEVRTGDQASPGGAGLDVAVDPPVEPIKQKTDKVCWAAGGTMMLAWKRRVSMSVEAALDSLGGDSRAKYDADTALDGAQFRDFAGALGLTEEGPTSYTPAGLARLLGTHGPLLVVTDDSFGPGNLLVHVRIVTAVRGDGTPDGTTVVLADSTSGRLEPEPFTRFAGRLEAAEAVEFGAGIFHF